MQKRILAFVYDFEHNKSVQGLLSLKTLGADVICLAAPKKVLPFKPSKTRVAPKVSALHPRDVAKAFGYPYVPIDHDSMEVLKYAHLCDVGVILGARILKRFITEKLPIINMHPGLLPENRGLDNLKWAIYKNLPQGVTAHIVDHRIDRGQMLLQEIVPVYEDDSFVDVFLRLQDVERQLMVKSLMIYDQPGIAISKGNYFSSMPDDLDAVVKWRFGAYKKNYAQIVDAYKNAQGSDHRAKVGNGLFK